MGKKIICIVGQLGSGKGTAADYFVKQGYKSYALRDRLREMMEKSKVVLTRVNMQDYADDLRQKLGNDIFAKKTEDLILKDKSEKFVVESFRNPAEVLFFKNKYNAKVLGIVATAKNRFKYLSQRGRLGDPKTLAEFKKVDRRDKGIGQMVFGQQSAACLKMADVVIKNNGTVHELWEKIKKYEI